MMTPTNVECAQLDHALSAYLSNTLDERANQHLEQHAASCARCEALLLLRTSAPAQALVDAFVPEVPSSLRDDTLAAVAVAREVRARQLGRGMRWRVALTTVAAVAAVVVAMVMRRSPPASTTATTSESIESVGAAMLGVAEQLADEQSRAEFLQLDAAAAEVEQALMRAPADAELRAYRAAVEARRDELARRVRDVTL